MAIVKNEGKAMDGEKCIWCLHFFVVGETVLYNVDCPEEVEHLDCESISGLKECGA